MPMARCTTRRCPVELTGRNSVTPSTRPSTTALGTLSSFGVSDDEDEACARATAAAAAAE